MIKNKFLLLSILLISLIITGCSKDDNKKEINISVASSLKDSMIEIKEEYESINKDINLVINYGSSGTLKQQIEQGAPCDIFISAGKEEVDYLDKKGLLYSESIQALLTNELVLIAPQNSHIDTIEDINLEEIQQIGIGYPESVPVGKYAYETLESLNIYQQIDDKLIYAKDVKEVLAWVQSGNIDLGFVYFTDTVKNDKVKIIHKVNKNNHSEIIYPVSIINQSKEYEEVRGFYEFLVSNQGKEIFSKYGYKY